MKKIILAAALFSLSSLIEAAVQGKEVTYTANGTTLKGYLAYDDAITHNHPAVLVVHEWWGLDDYARKRAKMLAEMGYTALAVDMYGEGRQAHHPDEASRYSEELKKNLPLAKKRFEAGLNFLQKQENVDPKNIAALGYCFGGSVALEMARQGEDLKGVASFHGGLATEHPAQRGKEGADYLFYWYC